jgi:hypothetical protein
LQPRAERAHRGLVDGAARAAIAGIPRSGAGLQLASRTGVSTSRMHAHPVSSASARSKARVESTFIRSHGLTLVLIALFLISLAGQAWTGWRKDLEELHEHGRAPESLGEYVTSGSFLESVGENWEGEFLQMWALVYLGTVLVQRGSPESREHVERGEDIDEDPREHRGDRSAPWPVRRGGFALALYEHSLGLGFFAMYLVGLFLHAFGGLHAYNEDRLHHGLGELTLFEYLGSSRFWFESLQNWESEFVSAAALVFFTVYLRQRFSPQSKPVATPHWRTE